MEKIKISFDKSSNKLKVKIFKNRSKKFNFFLTYSQLIHHLIAF